MRSLIILLLFSLPCAEAQTFSKEHSLEDLRFLQESIIHYNPALYRYNPTFDTESKNLLQSIPEDASLMDYFGLISQLCALSNEGHFAMGSWGDTVHAGIAKNRDPFLPLSLVVIDGHVYVWKDLSEEGPFSDGDEIISINGKPITTILNDLTLCIPTDGNIQTYTEYQLTIGFSYSYYFFLDQSPDFTIEFINQGSQKEVSVKALTQEQQMMNYKERYNPPPGKKPGIEDFYELQMEDQYAVFKLKSFSHTYIDEYKIKPSRFYRDIFRKIQEAGIKNLIIDLRGNTGGRNEFADDMVPYILKENTEAPFLKKTVSWKGKEREYRFPRRKKGAFKGTIYVLVNGSTYSNGSTLARYLREYGGAIVIGEETGTRYEGFAAGSKHYVILPHSGLRIGIPRYHIFFPQSELQPTQNRGLIPDHQVKKSVSDLLNDTDPVMDFALKLINP